MDEHLYRIVHSQEKALSERRNLLITIKNKTADVASICEASVLNESYKETDKKDGAADFIRLLDILFEVPTDVLTDEHLTLDELMNKGRILDQTHNQQEAG
eukprot:3147369-Ditylum_brightwellii.AAC.1